MLIKRKPDNDSQTILKYTEDGLCPMTPSMSRVWVSDLCLRFHSKHGIETFMLTLDVDQAYMIS